jgi:hypothetical protein
VSESGRRRPNIYTLTGAVQLWSARVPRNRTTCVKHTTFPLLVPKHMMRTDMEMHIKKKQGDEAIVFPVDCLDILIIL